VTVEPFDPDVSRWDAWHPAEVARRLADIGAPWAVIAGWSLDLFRGEQTREHEDLEIGIPQTDFAAVRGRLADFELYALVDGKAVVATQEALAAGHQTWVREPATRIWRLDVIREPWDGDTWICRRDPRLRLPREELIAHTADGIPYQRPEIALLFKAKRTRDKDRVDFDSVLPLLDDDARSWLRNALELVHPGHEWLAALG
jgi:hypothetical protein